jgi:predicted ATP-grasp superfamily ATP-dependent carboligase
MNSPAGTTTISGHSGQSLKLSFGLRHRLAFRLALNLLVLDHRNIARRVEMSIDRIRGWAAFQSENGLSGLGGKRIDSNGFALIHGSFRLSYKPR